jgi:hypothetical protein
MNEEGQVVAEIIQLAGERKRRDVERMEQMQQQTVADLALLPADAWLRGAQALYGSNDDIALPDPELGHPVIIAEASDGSGAWIEGFVWVPTKAAKEAADAEE